MCKCKLYLVRKSGGGSDVDERSSDVAGVRAAVERAQMWITAGRTLRQRSHRVVARYLSVTAAVSSRDGIGSPGHGSPGQRFWPGRVTGQCVRPGV